LSGKSPPAVEAVAIERLRGVDEAEPIAVGLDVTDPDVGRPVERFGIRDAEGEARPGFGRYGHATVERQEDVDRPVGGGGELAERPGEGVDDVAQPARLRPRLALGGDEDDAQRHRPMVAAGHRPQAAPRVRPS